MSQLNQLPNLRVEDFPSEQSWINRLFVQLNPFMQGVSNLFNNNIDFSTNIKSITKTYTLTSFTEFSFLWSFTDSTPLDVRVIKATKGTQQDPCILLISWEYSSENKSITVTNLVEITSSGVQALDGSTYNLLIRATV